MDPEVEKIIRNSIKKLEDLKIKIEEISLPHTEYALANYYIIMPSEVSANLARYDGIKYGHSITREKGGESKNLLDVYLKSREEGFGEEVRRRIMLGTYALSAGYYEAYYLRAQKVRTLIKKDFEEAFKKVDLILTPVSPTPAFKIGEKITDPLTMYLSDIFTIAPNLAGLPDISIPVGKIGKLPVGLHPPRQTVEQVAHGVRIVPLTEPVQDKCLLRPGIPTIPQVCVYSLYRLGPEVYVCGGLGLLCLEGLEYCKLIAV